MQGLFYADMGEFLKLYLNLLNQCFLQSFLLKIFLWKLRELDLDTQQRSKISPEFPTIAMGFCWRPSSLGWGPPEFPLCGELRESLHYPNVWLVFPAPLMVFPRNVEFVAFMQFLVILSKMSPFTVNTKWEILDLEFLLIPWVHHSNI